MLLLPVLFGGNFAKCHVLSSAGCCQDGGDEPASAAAGVQKHRASAPGENAELCRWVQLVMGMVPDAL